MCSKVRSGDRWSHRARDHLGRIAVSWLVTAETPKCKILFFANIGRAKIVFFIFLWENIKGVEVGDKKGGKEKRKNREKDEHTQCEEKFEKN